MNNPIDKNINKFHKGFQTTKRGQFEDPTYLGFRLVFDFNPSHRNMETGLTDDPLFSEKDELESAIRYLKSTGYPNRAKMLQKFKENLKYVNDETPWYWQSLSGLQDVWKIEFGENFNPFRAKDKVLEITCLESIDLRITALADLYRKAVFDSKFMRSLVPENLRWFTLRVQVAEMRSFQKVKEAIEKLSGPLDFNSNLNPNTAVVGTAVNSATGGVTALASNVTGGLPDFLKKPGSHDVEMENIDNLVSLMEFHFSHCTFDFSESFPSDKELSMNGDMQMAKQKFKINVGHIEENHQYKIMDLVLKDGINQENGAFQIKIPNLDNALTKKAEGIFSTALQGATSQLQDKLSEIAGIPGNLIAGAKNKLQSTVTSAVLGNVYDARNQTLGTLVNSFLGKSDQIGGTKITAGENALTQPPITQPLGKEDVYPDVPGTGLNTKENGPQGNIYK